MLAALAVGGVGACTRVHTTHLHFAHLELEDAGLQSDLISGFHCSDASPTPCLLLMLTDGGEDPQDCQNLRRNNPTVPFTVVVDFLQNVPSGLSDTYELFSYCDGTPGNCPLVPGTRQCFSVTLPDAGALSLASHVAEAVNDQLDGGLVLASAPASPVVVRAVSTHEGCPPESQTTFDLHQLVGCAHSIPTSLGDTDSVELLLNTNTSPNYGQCTAALCANAPGCQLTSASGDAGP